MTFVDTSSEVASDIILPVACILSTYISSRAPVSAHRHCHSRNLCKNIPVFLLLVVLLLSELCHLYHFHSRR